jgi:predicted TIM-barrel fold metal-dependent hydrolase
MIIDFHTHILPSKVKNNRSEYAKRDAAFAGVFSGETAKITTAEDLIDSMDRNGIDVSVAVNYSWTTLRFCKETNDYILESISRYPKRLIGFCAASSLTDDASLKEIERCVKGGARGVGELRPDTQSLDYSKKDILKPFTDLVKKHKLIVLTHTSEPVGHRYTGKGAATPDIIYMFINHFPDLPVVCAHWGGGLPFYELMPEVREALEDVYFDTAASPYLYRPEIYLQASQLIGADRILFGTDFPVIAQSRVLNEIQAAGLTEENREEILSGNARRLLGI